MEKATDFSLPLGSGKDRLACGETPGTGLWVS